MTDRQRYRRIKQLLPNIGELSEGAQQQALEHLDAPDGGELCHQLS